MLYNLVEKVLAEAGLKAKKKIYENQDINNGMVITSMSLIQNPFLLR